MNWRAQAQGVRKSIMRCNCGAQSPSGMKADVVVLQRLVYGVPVAAEWNAQQVQQLLAVQTARCVGTTTVH